MIWVYTVCSGLSVQIYRLNMVTFCLYSDDSSTVVMSDTPRPASMADDSPPPAVSIEFSDQIHNIG